MIFKSQAQCFNCGFTDFYHFPTKHILIDFEISKENESGHYHIDKTEDDLEPINCHNCGLPRIRIVFWNPNDEIKVPKEVEGQDEPPTISRAG